MSWFLGCELFLLFCVCWLGGFSLFDIVGAGFFFWCWVSSLFFVVVFACLGVVLCVVWCCVFLVCGCSMWVLLMFLFGGV